MAVDNPIYVALDLGSAEEATKLAQRIAPHVGGFKIGLGLLHGPGPAVVGAVASLGLPVFADAKLHDIPTQVRSAARSLARHGARWITAHASGSSEMLEAAVEGAGSVPSGDAGILGVTVLTSLGGADLTKLGFGSSPGKLVSRLAKIVEGAGCEGLVCSPQELGIVRDVAPGLVTFVPGIRPEGVPAHDQVRTATPQEAIMRGAAYLVVGRAITAAHDPVAAAAAIAESVKEFLQNS
ncbi:MAG: orotidine-5'-phosphate decarboxylase [Acidobacteria bacterium]|nr:orotidine-5'-phosphate decarboxylase [Acidobacteriota bacterium]